MKKNIKINLITLWGPKVIVIVLIQVQMLYFAVCLSALNLKKNSEVIVPSITDVGCVTPIILMGLKPVQCDIDHVGFNINIEQIKKKITSKTKAVIVAHIGGEVANIIRNKKFFKKKKIYLIEDCSQSHGAKINGIRVGNFGDISFFSTMASKLHCTGWNRWCGLF